MANDSPPIWPTTSWQRVADEMSLTKSEVNALQALFQGDGQKRMAERLGISVRAAHARLERLHRKLGVHSRTELLAFVAQRLTAP